MCVRVCLHAGSVAIIETEVIINILTTYIGLLKCLDAAALMLVLILKRWAPVCAVHFNHYVRNINKHQFLNIFAKYGGAKAIKV